METIDWKVEQKDDLIRYLSGDIEILLRPRIQEGPSHYLAYEVVSHPFKKPSKKMKNILTSICHDLDEREYSGKNPRVTMEGRKIKRIDLALVACWYSNDEVQFVQSNAYGDWSIYYEDFPDEGSLQERVGRMFGET